jgi:hypothetical protein
MHDQNNTIHHSYRNIARLQWNDSSANQVDFAGDCPFLKMFVIVASGNRLIVAAVCCGNCWSALVSDFHPVCSFLFSLDFLTFVDVVDSVEFLPSRSRRSSFPVKFLLFRQSERDVVMVISICAPSGLNLLLISSNVQPIR